MKRFAVSAREPTHSPTCGPPGAPVRFLSVSPPPRIPGLDRDGFAPAATVKALAARLELEEFLVVFPAPSLQLEAVDVEDALYQPGEELENILGPGAVVPPDEKPLGGRGALRGPLRVPHQAPGQRVPRDHLRSDARRTTTSRSIFFSVSKVHGYFRQEGDAWTYTDQGSTNGTSWNAKPIKANEKCRLADDDRLGFGEELVARFRTPRALYAWARAAR